MIGCTERPLPGAKPSLAATSANEMLLYARLTRLKPVRITLRRRRVIRFVVLSA